ncbi:6-phosphogluconolactonase [Sphingomonas sp. KC8]|uniref:6-phosphogluconolactonase n=1 Tax=Sphingomonas sp. KC8 TaxID=1030157 RepID=UPI0002488F6B|nr:6-phosphogluconolactonase [Sphingomonas sp. KC8]ARS27978.1 6-phosphogluconolactonase [Sphingomonas sp. KC8]
MIEAEWWDYDDTDEMAAAVAGDVGFIIESALDARGQALIALPGGTTPAPIFAKLAEARIKWKNVTIIPTDDRLVAVSDPLSNIASIAKIFLPLGARVMPIVSEAAADHTAAGKAADARLQDLHWPPDLVWLGVGADGHTASIFPGPDLEEALNGPNARRAVGVLPDPMPKEAPVARVTLTRAAILSARTLLITVTGDAKRKMLEKAIEDGPLSSVPIGRVLADTELPIDIHWAAE